MFGLWSANKKKRTPKPSIDGLILEEHLLAIRTCCQEILNFRKKKMTSSPAHVFWKPVDIEETWPTLSEVMSSTLGLLYKVAGEVHVYPAHAGQLRGLRDSLELFTAILDQIGHHIHNTRETQGLTQEQLMAIDREILVIQDSFNRMHVYITRTFTYSSRLYQQNDRTRAVSLTPEEDAERRIAESMHGATL